MDCLYEFDIKFDWLHCTTSCYVYSFLFLPWKVYIVVIISRNWVPFRSTWVPKNASEVKSFLGLVNFSARYIPNLATISEPLRKLTRKNEQFCWGKEQQNSFQKLKQSLSEKDIQGYFSFNAEKTQLITDASNVGLGTVLVQQNRGQTKVISYASRTLTEAEKKYSTTEKRALQLYGLVKNFIYTYTEFLSNLLQITNHWRVYTVQNPGQMLEFSAGCCGWYHTHNQLDTFLDHKTLLMRYHDCSVISSQMILIEEIMQRNTYNSLQGRQLPSQFQLGK